MHAKSVLPGKSVEKSGENASSLPMPVWCCDAAATEISIVLIKSLASHVVCTRERVTTCHFFSQTCSQLRALRPVKNSRGLIVIDEKSMLDGAFLLKK